MHDPEVDLQLKKAIRQQTSILWNTQRGIMKLHTDIIDTVEAKELR